MRILDALRGILESPVGEQGGVHGLFQGEVAWGRPIYKSEIQQKSAHNTYQIDGLPPTPICNPGKSALEATLNPAKTSDLYFVANGQGGHVFTTNLKDHNAAVANWRKVEQDLRAKQAAAAGAKAAGKATPLPPPAPTAASEASAGANGAGEAPAAKDASAALQSTPATADTAAVPLPVRKPKRP